jgi:hypothetical protein
MHLVRLAALSSLVFALAAIVIPGSDSWSGPILLSLTATHGVHMADLFVVGVAALVALYGLSQVRPAAAG